MILPIFIFGQQTKQKYPIPLAKFGENVKAPLTSQERNQVLEVYGDFADKYVFDNPNMLKNIKQILRNRVVIKTITNENEKKACPKLSTVSLFNPYVKNLKRDESFNPSNFNPLKYNFEFHSLSASMFQVDNSNYYIIIKSQYQ
jgi:hypothetical protein